MHAPFLRKSISPGTPGWMVTYGDMMSLLLTFFILLVSFAEMNVQKYRDMAGQMREAFGVQRAEAASDMPQGMDLVARDFNTAFTSEELLKKVKNTVKIPETGDVEILLDMRGVVLRLVDDSFFDPGHAKLRPNAWPVLDSISGAAREIANTVVIEAHTDPQEFAGSAFADNWALSAERAAEVVRYLEKQGKIDPRRLRPTARGATEPVPAATTGPEQRKNRRIEIVFEKEPDVGGKPFDRLFAPNRENRAPEKQPATIDLFQRRGGA